MNSSEFAYRKEVISKYFINDCKWKIDENGDYTYYKNPKRCLKELKFMLEIVFQTELEIIKIQEFNNYNNELIGYSIIGSVDVCGDFNGINQGEGRAIEYIKFTLCHKAFFFNQSGNLEYLLKEE